MIRITQDNLLKHPYPFSKLINLEYALVGATFDSFDSIINKHLDKFTIEYDETVDKHILLHQRHNCGKVTPICYIGKEDICIKERGQFLYHCLLEAYAEELI
jgi:hypothetical protein